jgi:CitMHS family citrate-Mg2+:H+ or citrate-Ca2+:H+ symporter
MAIAGFLTILVFLVAIISKRLSVITALVLIPISAALIMGFPVKELGPMMLDGIKQVAPTGIMLVFAVLYFAIMLDVGLFDPVIRRLLKLVGGDPLKVILGTAILTMLVHLDGDGTATFMIVISAFLPLYERLQIK